jgi:CBS domain containing-hemolysin-like protein
MEHSQTVLYVLAFVLSLFFSGFFAGSETALVSLGRIDLQPCASGATGAAPSSGT